MRLILVTNCFQSLSCVDNTCFGHVFAVCQQRQKPCPGCGTTRRRHTDTLPLSPHLVVWIRCAVALVEPPVFPGVAPRQRADRRAPCHSTCHATARGVKKFLH
jgi:hypothetical protein